ncbi:hypothetical protein BGX38DRAFT_765985 [Terfezia claveryi]|nr:hypothetical protein BGX38DRAFT_765985 [Terfezia claveryi]
MEQKLHHSMHLDVAMAPYILCRILCSLLLLGASIRVGGGSQGCLLAVRCSSLMNCEPIAPPHTNLCSPTSAIVDTSGSRTCIEVLVPTRCPSLRYHGIQVHYLCCNISFQTLLSCTLASIYRRGHGSLQSIERHSCCHIPFSSSRWAWR